MTELINSGWEFHKEGALCYLCGEEKGFNLMKFLIGSNKKSGDTNGNDIP